MMMMAPAVAKKRTPIVVLLASLSCVVVRGQNTAGGGGSAACPCIQPSTPPVEDGTCVDVMVGDTQLCLSPAYGVGSCQAWDSHSPADQVAGASPAVGPFSECGNVDAPSWCSSHWCWVDADQCDRSHTLSAVEFDTSEGAAPEADLLPLSDHVAYSYTTCGNLDSYSENLYVQQMQGRTLRVAFPGDSGTGYTLVTDPAAGIVGTKTGSVVAFMQAVAERGNFQWEIQNVTAASKATYPGSVSARAIGRALWFSVPRGLASCFQLWWTPAASRSCVRLTACD
jgi:hypothetical protein